MSKVKKILALLVFPSHASKIFKRIVLSQKNLFFNSKFSPLLTGFRKNHSTQNAVLNMFEKWKHTLGKGKKVGAISIYTYTWNNLLLARLCVCVVYSSTCWFLPAARHVWHTWEVRINDLLLWVFLGATAKFLHLYLWIYLISPPKTKTPANRLLERKRYDIMFGIRRKDDIYWYRK